MLIKFNSDNDEFHDRLLEATGLRTVTGAYRSAAVNYPGLKRQVRYLQAQLDELKRENISLRQTLIDARDAALLLAEKASPPRHVTTAPEHYLGSEYAYKGWRSVESPHFQINEVGNPVREGGRMVQLLEFSNGGVFKASWNPDFTDMKIIELSKLSLFFIPGDEGLTFYIKISPE